MAPESVLRQRASAPSTDMGTSTTVAAETLTISEDDLQTQCLEEFDARSQLKAEFMDLPPEIHMQIASYLSYPDALALKHTSYLFYSFVNTGVKLKVAWLVDRQLLRLPGPTDKRINMRTDVDFCRGSVSTMIRKRRQHIECKERPDLGCLISGDQVCPFRSSQRDGRLGRNLHWLHKKLTARKATALDLWVLPLLVLSLVWSLGWLGSLLGVPVPQ